MSEEKPVVEEKPVALSLEVNASLDTRNPLACDLVGRTRPPLRERPHLEATGLLSSGRVVDSERLCAIM
jgi:hypothetical protein